MKDTYQTLTHSFPNLSGYNTVFCLTPSNILQDQPPGTALGDAG